MEKVLPYDWDRGQGESEVPQDAYAKAVLGEYGGDAAIIDTGEMLIPAYHDKQANMVYNAYIPKNKEE